MYAIVDIETTGSSYKTGRITEIAILIHDGKEIVKRYHTLVNPHCRIPYHITQLTGITNEMILDAPAFYEIARDVVEITKDLVFVAHNAAFDYSFIKAAFKDLGYEYQRKTLCTVKLARISFPGLSSYSLGNICDNCGIEIDSRHRALGDAIGTAALFSKIIAANPEAVYSNLFPAEIKKATLPPLLDVSFFENIPSQVTGVYYFYNSKRDVIYIGKSKDIKKRLLQHFSAKRGRKKLRMLHEIADVWSRLK
jgi:DNA polymerase III subunit epsilon